jgi:hypothetical protein
MYWQAPMIDRWIEHDTLRAAFAEVFELDPCHIEVADDTRMLTGPVPPIPRIVLETVRRGGPVPLQLNVFVGGDELEQPIAALAGTLIRARQLAGRLNAVMLFGDGPIGHEEQIRVAPDGTIDIVQLDGDELDEDRFVIIGARPFTPWTVEASPSSIRNRDTWRTDAARSDPATDQARSRPAV